MLVLCGHVCVLGGRELQRTTVPISVKRPVAFWMLDTSPLKNFGREIMDVCCYQAVDVAQESSITQGD